MKVIDYKKICQDLISQLKEKEKEVIVRRFGLKKKEKETLQSIGNSLGITRERVRQIQQSAEKKVRLKLKNYQEIIEFFEKYLKENGGVKKEETLFTELGENFKNEIFFLLKVSAKFKRINEKKEFYPFWALDEKAIQKLREIISKLSQKLEKEGKPLSFEELIKGLNFERKFLESALEISKRIQKNQKGFFGLREWPEINPRRVRDKVYLIFKEFQKPFHFTELANYLKGENLATIHNELIKDERFVLIGRGIYALREWGYYPGQVREVIFKILREKGRPMTKEEILNEVKKQRIVKESTVLINLCNKKYFVKTEEGKYWIKSAEI